VKPLLSWQNNEEYKFLSVCLWPYFSGMENVCTVLFSHLLSVWLYRVFPHCLIKAQFSEKFIEYNLSVLISSITFCLYHFLFSEEFTGILSQIHTEHHAKCLLFFSDFNPASIFSTDFRKMLKLNFMKIRPLRAEMFHTDRRLD